MARLIDADALADNIAVLFERNQALIEEWLMYHVEDAIDEAPTIDAVPVIRCKDCMYADSYYHCTWVNFWGTADDYCSRAKPRMNEVMT